MESQSYWSLTSDAVMQEESRSGSRNEAWKQEEQALQDEVVGSTTGEGEKEERAM